MKIITVGIDLAKNVFAVHGIDEQGKAALVQLRQELRTRNQAFDQLKPLESWQPLAEKHSDPAYVKSRLEMLDGLMSPVLQENGDAT